MASKATPAKTPSKVETGAAAAPGPEAELVFEFGDAPVPAQVRKSTAVNPLMDVCKVLGEQFVIDGATAAKTVTAKSPVVLAKIKRWLALAGPLCGVTFRSTFDPATGLVTFWPVERIVRKAKGTEATD